MPSPINLQLNGTKVTLQADIEASALEVLRQQGNVSSPKLVCGTGACGACTILVDQQPKCACITPAHHLEGRSVTTTEAHAQQGDLHPVQKAFLASDALQCGYCTPGFVNASVAFYNEWRKAHGKQRPTRDQVAEGLAGNLCRCGAYAGIHEAVADACQGKYDTGPVPEYSRVDARIKVEGGAKYTTDIRLDGQLESAFLRSPYAHARVASIDLGPAQAASGVKAVIALLNEEKTLRYHGQPIAAVAATTRAEAEAAAKQIRITYEELPAVLDMEAALQPDSKLVYPDTKVVMPLASEGALLPGSWEGNKRKTLLSITTQNAGSARNAFEKAPENRRVQQVTRTDSQYHTALEPHNAIAHWPAEDQLILYASTQAVHWVAEELAHRYKLKPDQVELRAEHVGGAFGAKLGLTREITTAVELARLAKAPVSVRYTRAEELTDAGYRPATKAETSISISEDGAKAGVVINGYTNAGVAIGNSLAEIAGLGYPGLDKDLSDYDVVTNHPSGSPFRGPGGPAACFALEQALDQLAHQMERDPLAMRRDFEQEEGHLEILEWIQEHPIWKSRPETASEKGRIMRGVGMAFGAWMHLYVPSAEVEVGFEEGKIAVRCAVQDMGQGAKSVLAAAVADVFGIPPTSIAVIVGSSKYPIGPASGGSRTSASIFPAAKEAAEEAAKDLLKLADQKGLGKFTKVEDGKLVGEGSSLPVQDAIQGLETKWYRIRRGRNAGFNPLGLMPLAQGLVIGQGRGYGAFVVEVEVDRLTGKVKATKVACVMRTGRVYVKPTAISQCQGGAIQGIGHALYERGLRCPQSGATLSTGLEDYRIPGIGDIPPIEVDFIERGFDFAKEKGIGLAELCTTPVAAAIANAVFNATGWRPLQVPILPGKVMEGLKGK